MLSSAHANIESIYANTVADSHVKQSNRHEDAYVKAIGLSKRRTCVILRMVYVMCTKHTHLWAKFVFTSMVHCTQYSNNNNNNNISFSCGS